jgi:hypothetical protein
MVLIRQTSELDAVNASEYHASSGFSSITLSAQYLVHVSAVNSGENGVGFSRSRVEPEELKLHKDGTLRGYEIERDTEEEIRGEEVSIDVVRLPPPRIT